MVLRGESFIISEVNCRYCLHETTVIAYTKPLLFPTLNCHDAVSSVSSWFISRFTAAASAKRINRASQPARGEVSSRNTAIPLHETEKRHRISGSRGLFSGICLKTHARTGRVTSVFRFASEYAQVVRSGNRTKMSARMHHDGSCRESC